MTDVTRKINLQAGDASAVKLIDRGTAALVRQQTGVQRLAAIYARDTRRFESDLDRRIKALRLEERQVERTADAYESAGKASARPAVASAGGNVGGGLGAVERFTRGVGLGAGAEVSGLIGDILDVKEALPTLGAGLKGLLTSVGPLGIGLGIVAVGFSALTSQLAAGKREVDASVVSLLKRREVERQIRDEALGTEEVMRRLVEARQREQDALADRVALAGVDDAAFAESQRNMGDLGARIGTALVSLGGGFNSINDAVTAADASVKSAQDEIRALEAALQNGTAAANDTAAAEEELARTRQAQADQVLALQRRFVDAATEATNEARRVVRDRGTDGLQELIDAAEAEYDIVSKTAGELRRAAETDYAVYGEAAKAANLQVTLLSKKILAYNDVLRSQDTVISKLTGGLASLTSTIGNVATSLTDLARKRAADAQAALDDLLVKQRENEAALLAEAQRRDTRLAEAQSASAERIADLRKQLLDREDEFAAETLRRQKEHQRDLKELAQDGRQEIKDLIRTGNFAEAIAKDSQLKIDERRLEKRFKLEERARADELELFRKGISERIAAEQQSLTLSLNAIQTEYDAKARSYSDQKLALADLAAAEMQRISATKAAMIAASESALTAIAAGVQSKLQGIFAGLGILAPIAKALFPGIGGLLPLPNFGGLSSASSAGGRGGAGRGGVNVQINTAGMFDGAAIGDVASMDQVETVVAYAQEQTGQAVRMMFQQLVRSGGAA